MAAPTNLAGGSTRRKENTRASLRHFCESGSMLSSKRKIDGVYPGMSADLGLKGWNMSLNFEILSSAGCHQCS